MIQQLKSQVEGDTTIYLLAIENSTVIGVLRIDPDCYILSVFVIEECQGQGVGSGLIQEAEDLLRRAGKKTVGLSVHDTNEKALAFYERRGYLPYITVRDGYRQFIKVL